MRNFLSLFFGSPYEPNSPWLAGNGVSERVGPSALRGTNVSPLLAHGVAPPPPPPLPVSFSSFPFFLSLVQPRSVWAPRPYRPKAEVVVEGGKSVGKNPNEKSQENKEFSRTRLRIGTLYGSSLFFLFLCLFQNFFCPFWDVQVGLYFLFFFSLSLFFLSVTGR